MKCEKRKKIITAACAIKRRILTRHGRHQNGLNVVVVPYTKKKKKKRPCARIYYYMGVYNLSGGAKVITLLCALAITRERLGVTCTVHKTSSVIILIHSCVRVPRVCVIHMYTVYYAYT